MQALALVLSLLFGAAPAGAADPFSPRDCEAGYDALHRLSRDRSIAPRVLEARLVAELDRQFPQRQRFAGATSCQRFEFRAVKLVDFHAPRAVHVARLHALLRSLDRAGVASRDDQAAFVEVLIAHRRFREASRLAAADPSLSIERPVPEVRGAAGMRRAFSVLVPRSPGELDVESRARAIEARGRSVLVVAHPNCGFSNRAMTTIGAYPGLSASLGKFIWLAPVDRRLALADLLGWNRAHPRTQVHVATHADRWPIVDDWATPTFYLLEDGRVVSRLSGWQDERHLPALRRFLAGG